MIEKVEFDQHRWYTVVYIHYVDGHTEQKVIGCADPGEGPYMFDSLEEYEQRASG